MLREWFYDEAVRAHDMAPNAGTFNRSNGRATPGASGGIQQVMLLRLPRDKYAGCCEQTRRRLLRQERFDAQHALSGDAKTVACCALR